MHKEKWKNYFLFSFVIATILFSLYITKASETANPTKGYFITEIGENFEGLENLVKQSSFYTSYKIFAGEAKDNIKPGIKAEEIYFITKPYSRYAELNHTVSLYFNGKNCPFNTEGIYRYIIKPVAENPEFIFDEEEYILDIYVGIVKVDKWEEEVKDKDGNTLKDEDGNVIKEKFEKKHMGIKATVVYNGEGEKVTNITGKYEKAPEISVKNMNIILDATRFYPIGTAKPNEIIVKVYQCKNGEIVKYQSIILNEENGWYYNVVVPQSIGDTTYQYYVEQDELELYRTTYSKVTSLSNPLTSSTNMMITNTYNAFDLTLNVNWKTCGDSEKPKIDFDIYRKEDGKVSKVFQVEDQNNFTKIIQLAKTSDGKSVSYYIKPSKNIEGYNITIDKANSPDNAINSATTVNITCEEQGTTELPVTLYWSASDDYSKENMRVSLYANDKIIQTKSVEFQDGEEYPECNILFEELKMYSNGTPIQYKLKLDGNEKGHIIGSINQDILKEHILSTEIKNTSAKIYIGEKIVPETGISANVQYSFISITIVIFATIGYMYMKKKAK